MMNHAAEHRHAVVVGATGMVGLPLCETLIEQGWAVTGIARGRNAERREQLEKTGTRFTAFDITTDDPARLPDADVVFLEMWDPRHIRGDHLEDVWSLNFDAIGRIVHRYCGIADVINGSTGSLYGSRGDRPSLETDAPRPSDDYSLARLAQEKLINYFAQQGGRRALHLRYFHANKTDSGVIRHFAQSIWSGQSLGPDPDARLQVIHVDDFVLNTASAVEQLATFGDPSRPDNAINICHPRIWTQRELAERIAHELGRKQVFFDRETGGQDASVWGDTQRMIETCGEPTVAMDLMIQDICRAIRQAP